MLRLSNSTLFNSGSAYLKTPLALGDDAEFMTNFEFIITDSGGLQNGADGLTFALVPELNDLGGDSGNIGFAGVSPSVIVELDTYDNPWDPNGNHVGVNLDGDRASITTEAVTPDFNNTEVWNVWVNYNDPITPTIDVFLSLSNTMPITPTLSYAIDLNDVFDEQDSVFFGFTSATGNGFGNHDLVSWEFEGNTFFISDVVITHTVPSTISIGATTVPPTSQSGQAIQWDFEQSNLVQTIEVEVSGDASGLAGGTEILVSEETIVSVRTADSVEQIVLPALKVIVEDTTDIGLSTIVVQRNTIPLLIIISLVLITIYIAYRQNTVEVK